MSDFNKRRDISSDDPEAIQKLKTKLENCQIWQERMKAANAYYRKHGTCKGCPGMSDDVAARHDARIEKAPSWQKQPFPGYELSNNNAEISRVKKRIEQLTRDKDTGFEGWEFQGGNAVANADINRLQLFFDEKPDEATRSALKRSGFHWSSSEGAWQRQLNQNSMYAADRLDFLKPLDGRSVREHQPKAPAPKRDTDAR